MNRFRDAVESLKNHTRAQLQTRLQDAVALGDSFGVAVVLAELNARDCHDYESPGFRTEQAERDIADVLEEAYE